MGSSSKETTQTTSGGGSSTSTTTSTPFQQQYYAQLLGQANNLYKQGPMQMYGGQTVANMTPAQMESMNQTSNWVTGGAQDQMANTQNTWNQMMSGQNNMGSAFTPGLESGFQSGLGSMMSGRVNTGAGSPYGDMMNVYKNQVMDSAHDMMGQLRSSQVMSGQVGGSSRGDLLNNRVIDEANQQVANAGAQMYNNAYTQAQAAQQAGIGQYNQAQMSSMNNAAQTQMGALGQYGSIMNQPLEMSKQLYNRVGLPQQQYNQAIMDDARTRFQFGQTAPWQHLAQYANMISGNFGGTNTAQSESGHHSTTTLV